MENPLLGMELKNPRLSNNASRKKNTHKKPLKGSEVRKRKVSVQCAGRQSLNEILLNTTMNQTAWVDKVHPEYYK